TRDYALRETFKGDPGDQAHFCRRRADSRRPLTIAAPLQLFFDLHDPFLFATTESHHRFWRKASKNFDGIGAPSAPVINPRALKNCLNKLAVSHSASISQQRMA